MTPEERERILSDSLSQMKFVKQANAKTEFDRLFDRLDDSFDKVISTIKPVLQAGGGFDKQSLRHLVFTTLLEELSSFSKDDLHAICVSIFADRIMDDVNSRPWGNDNPDLLSGK